MYLDTARDTSAARPRPQKACLNTNLRKVPENSMKITCHCTTTTLPNGSLGAESRERSLTAHLKPSTRTSILDISIKVDVSPTCESQAP